MSLIRQAQAGDADGVFELARGFATSFTPNRRRFDIAFAHLLAQDDAQLFIAMDDSGAVVGYLLGFDHFTLFANGRVAWVEEIMVAETARKRGHGRRLTRMFERWAQKRGAALVALATRRAAEFYVALGYEESAVYFRKLL